MPIGYQKQIDTVEQSQLERFFQVYLIREDKTDITLVSDVTIGALTIEVSSGHGFLANQTPPHYLTIECSHSFQQRQVADVNGNLITLKAPLSHAYEANDTMITRGIIDMNQDASSVNQSFGFSPRKGLIPVDISDVIITMTHTVAGDDGKFGGIDSLVNGMLVAKQNSILQPLEIYFSNADFKDLGWTVTYTEKGSGGTRATDISINLVQIFGKEIRVDPRILENIKATLRDNFSTLTRFRVSLLGSYTKGE